MIPISEIQEQVFKKIKLSPIERVNYKLMRGDKDFTEEDVDTIVKLLKQYKLDSHRFKDFPKDVIEKVILKSEDVWCAYYYALKILKSRWKEAEPYIMKNSYYAYNYALYILKSRWLEAEPIIKQDEYWWNEYRSYFNIKNG